MVLEKYSFRQSSLSLLTLSSFCLIPYLPGLDSSMSEISFIRLLPIIDGLTLSSVMIPCIRSLLCNLIYSRSVALTAVPAAPYTSYFIPVFFLFFAGEHNPA